MFSLCVAQSFLMLTLPYRSRVVLRFSLTFSMLSQVNLFLTGGQFPSPCPFPAPQTCKYWVYYFDILLTWASLRKIHIQYWWNVILRQCCDWLFFRPFPPSFPFPVEFPKDECCFVIKPMNCGYLIFLQPCGRYLNIQLPTVPSSFQHSGHMQHNPQSTKGVKTCICRWLPKQALTSSLSSRPALCLRPLTPTSDLGRQLC